MPDLFLSYHRDDADAVLQVRQVLQAGGIQTFLDSQDLVAGLPWPQALERALASAKAVVVFVGRQIGTWQSREIGFALDRQAEAERDRQQPIPVIPVLLPGSDASIVPGFLRLNTWVDLRKSLENSEQLAALRAAIAGKADGQVALAAAAISPYRGLQEFREQDAAFFHGRDQFAKRLFDAVLRQAFVCLVGNSGSGKSSVAKAGLIPLLRRERPPRKTWDVVVTRPQKQPFYAVAGAFMPLLDAELSAVKRLREVEELGRNLQSGAIGLAGVVTSALTNSNGTDRLLLVVDQFEELFTLVDDAVRSAFVGCLLKALNESDLRILLIFRADFYGRVIGESRALSDLVEHGVINVGAMSREELHVAIEQPARMVGLEFESGLIARLLGDAADEPGSLPLVQFALTELSAPDRRSGNLLTHAAYDGIGQIGGSIAKRAEEEFQNLTEEQRTLAPRVFTRLVRVGLLGEGGQDTRQLADINDLNVAERGIVDAFVQARLLVTSRDEQSGRQVAQVAHEALIRRWKRLEQWVNDQREFLLWRQRLQLRIKEWKDAQDDPGALLRGALLSEARVWRERFGSEFGDEACAYLAASEQQDRRSREIEKQAVARGLASESSRLLQEDPTELERSVLLAIEALRRLAIPETYNAFMRSFDILPKRVATVRVEAPLVDAAFSPDGKSIVTASGNGEIRVLDSTSLAERFRLSAAGYPGQLFFSPDSRYFAVPANNFSLVAWRSENGEEIARVTHSGEKLGPMDTKRSSLSLLSSSLQAAFYKDGTLLITGHSDVSNVTIWRVPGGQLVTSAPFKEGLTCIATCQCANRVAIGFRDGQVMSLEDEKKWPRCGRQTGPSNRSDIHRTAEFSRLDPMAVRWSLCR